MKKTPRLIGNNAGGLDLLVERDAGSEIRILTGKTECSLKFWLELINVCTYAIDELATPSGADPASD